MNFMYFMLYLIVDNNKRLKDKKGDFYEGKNFRSIKEYS